MDLIVNAVQALVAAHQGFLLAVFLLSLRVSAVFVLTPLLQVFGVPPVIRVLFTLGMCVALVLGIDAAAMPDAASMSLGALLVAAATEWALGATLALGVIAAFASISMAGRFIDVQIGFGMAQVFDPATHRQIPVIQSAFERLGVIVFFLADGPHALLRGIAYSLERFPLGRGWPIEQAVPVVIKQIAGLFTLGLALAAPVIVCLLMVELALGVLARNLPQANMFMVGVPVKVVVGLAALSLWLAGSADAFNRIYGSIYKTWDGIFAAAPAVKVR